MSTPKHFFGSSRAKPQVFDRGEHIDEIQEEIRSEDQREIQQEPELKTEEAIIEKNVSLPVTTPTKLIDIPIIRKPVNKNPNSLRKLKVSRPSFDPTEGVDFENFASKKEAFLMGYLNALYHRLDGGKITK